MVITVCPRRDGEDRREIHISAEKNKKREATTQRKARKKSVRKASSAPQAASRWPARSKKNQKNNWFGNTSAFSRWFVYDFWKINGRKQKSLQQENDTNSEQAKGEQLFQHEQRRNWLKKEKKKLNQSKTDLVKKRSLPNRRIFSVLNIQSCIAR